jgi:hypothetical protein
MIEIKVEGNSLYLPTSTALTMEHSNAIFATDEIAGDIAFTFDLPAYRNERILGHAQYLSIHGVRKYDCTMLFNGIPFSFGKLYIQSSKKDSYACGITMNTFVEGFGEKKLSEDDLGDDVTISNDLEHHYSGWKRFLQNSLAKTSIYKFFLFIDSQFYSDNEDFGCRGVSDGNPRPMPLFGRNTNCVSSYINRLFVNDQGEIINSPEEDAAVTGSQSAVLATEGGDLVTTEDSTSAASTLIQLGYDAGTPSGLQLFNRATSTGVGQNGYAFCPALRLDWLVRRVFATANMEVVGNFLTNNDIQRLYLQSMNALDGDASQYAANLFIALDGSAIASCGDTPAEGAATFLSASEQKKSITLSQTGRNVNFRFQLYLSFLNLAQSVTAKGLNYYNKYDEIYMLVIKGENDAFPSLKVMDNYYQRAATRAEIVTESGWPFYSDIAQLYQNWPYISAFASNANDDCDTNLYIQREYGGVDWLVADTTSRVHLGRERKTICLELSPTMTGADHALYASTGKLAARLGRTIPAAISATASSPMHLYLVKCKSYYYSGTSAENWYCKQAEGDFSIPIRENTPARSSSIPRYLTDYEILDAYSVSGDGGWLNIFADKLHYADHVPSMTNAEFISKLCRTFGVSLFADTARHTAQLSFFKDILNSRDIDITSYIIDKETEKTTYEEKKYTVTIATVKEKDATNEVAKLTPIADHKDLPSPTAERKRHVFVKNENAYRRSVKSDEKWQWERTGANDATLECGDATNSEEVTETFLAPNMRWADTAGEGGASDTIPEKYICEVDAQGCSKMLDEEYKGEFEPIMMQYRGLRKIGITNTLTANIEDANPTCYRPDGTAVADAVTLAAEGEQSIGEKYLKHYYDFLSSKEDIRFSARVPFHLYQKIISTLRPQSGMESDQVRWLRISGQRFLPTKITAELSNAGLITLDIECSRKHIEI